MGRKAFAIFVALAFLYIASPLFLPLAMGGVFAVLFSPWLDRLENKKLSPELGSLILTGGITLVVILPMSLLVFLIAKTGVQQLETLRSSSSPEDGFVYSLMNSPKVHRLMVWVTAKVPVQIDDLSHSFEDLARNLGSKLADALGGVFGQLPGMLMGLVVIIVSIYFFLVDGRKLVAYCRQNTVFTPEQTERLIRTVAEMCRSVILASLVSGGVQALLEGVACAFSGVPNAALIGLLVFIASFVPVVGSAPITFGIALQQLLEGRQGLGVVLLVVAVIVAAADNAIRPWFLRGSANLHPLIAFIAAFGGLQSIGFVGVFLGPIVAALFVATAQILMRSEGPTVINESN